MPLQVILSLAEGGVLVHSNVTSLFHEASGLRHPDIPPPSDRTIRYEGKMDIGNDQANKTLVAVSVTGLMRASMNNQGHPRRSDAKSSRHPIEQGFPGGWPEFSSRLRSSG
jgi:hypothetical protein